MDQIRFDEFDLCYESYLTGKFPDVRPGLDSEDFYTAVIGELRQDPARYAQGAFGLSIEQGWYAQNRPEFKVYPGIIAALERTHVEIDSKFFKMPFPSFMVRFPHLFLRESDAAPYVRAMIVTTVREPLPKRTRMIDGTSIAISSPGDPIVDKLVIFVCIDNGLNFFKFPLIPGQTIQHAFNAARLRSDGSEVKQEAEFDRHGYWPSRALYMRLLQIAVGTAFFAIGRDRQKKHTLVEAEQLSRQERRQIARATGTRTRDASRPRFVVGREIELPRFESEAKEKTEVDPVAECASCGCQAAAHTGAGRSCSSEDCQCLQWDSGRHISYGYIRSGHLHFYAVGPRNPKEGDTNGYELRWIDPHPVRPDLPFGVPKARSLRPPTNEIISADITRLQNP